MEEGALSLNLLGYKQLKFILEIMFKEVFLLVWLKLSYFANKIVWKGLIYGCAKLTKIYPKQRPTAIIAV